MNPLPDDLKREREMQRLREEIHNKFEAVKKLIPANRVAKKLLILPENFTGKDLKRALKLKRHYEI